MKDWSKFRRGHALALCMDGSQPCVAGPLCLCLLCFRYLSHLSFPILTGQRLQVAVIKLELLKNDTGDFFCFSAFYSHFIEVCLEVGKWAFSLFLVNMFPHPFIFTAVFPPPPSFHLLWFCLQSWCSFDRAIQDLRGPSPHSLFDASVIYCLYAPEIRDKLGTQEEGGGRGKVEMASEHQVNALIAVQQQRCWKLSI